MKSIIAITILGIMSFFTNNNEKVNIVLDEYEVNLVNLDYELELENVDLMMSSNNFYLQNRLCENYSLGKVIELETIDLQIPNYKYLEELDTAEFN
jgi:hypothetical protein